jgi:multidrug resistance protein MdtO
MATLVQSVPKSQQPLEWFGEFLKQELAPYPGRAAIVARMVIAATLIMIICMTFRIPYAFQGALYALLISRESRRATLETAGIILLVTGIGSAYLLTSAWFVINSTPLHFLWFIGSLFLAFFATSVLTNYTAAVIFATMIAVGAPLWDRHLSAEANVEDTLWLCLATLIGISVTAGVELAFARGPAGDEVVLQIADRLSAVQNLLTCFAEGCAVDPVTEQRIIRLEMLGTSLLRRILRRSDYSSQYSANMGGVAALVGRLVDIAATLTQLRFEPSASDQRRLRNLASTIATIRNDLMNHKIPAPVQFNTERSTGAVPLLGEMEYTVTLIVNVYAGSRSIHEYLPSPDESRRWRLFAPDALVNARHLQFALKGCLAASSAYVIYNAVAWPGISTAVTTCLLTALSTVGASRQKQVLRITGAIVGGFVLGMGSQIFILPYLDSIAGFTVLFVIVTGLASWFMTSSPRLSYFGLQVALAFYLINLEEFKIRTSLGVARDRVVGILLGLFLMWFVFDRLWSVPAVVEMKRLFVSSLRLLAQLAREPLSKDIGAALAKSSALRETINAQFDQVRSAADSILFEFGPSRRQDLEIRSRVRQWQPRLRTLFLLRIASLEYRLQLPGFELPETMRVCQSQYDECSAQTLEEMADAIEGKLTGFKLTPDHCSELLERALQACCGPESERVPAVRIESFATLLRQIDQLTASLAKETALEFRPGQNSFASLNQGLP